MLAATGEGSERGAGREKEREERREERGRTWLSGVGTEWEEGAIAESGGDGDRRVAADGAGARMHSEERSGRARG
jgi:hypothetical protein